jgi:hypothetical protein
LPADRGDPLPHPLPASLLERFRVAPGPVLSNECHPFGSVAMADQHRRGRALDYVARDKSGPDASFPQLPQQGSPDRRETRREDNQDRNLLKDAHCRDLRNYLFLR